MSKATAVPVAGQQALRVGRFRVSITPVAARTAALMLLLALSAAGALALLSSGRPAMSSDESLYLSEALSIASGHGAVYTSGAPIVHRAFLFPALIAGEVKLAGADSPAVYWLPRIAAIAAALGLGLFVGRMFGAIAGTAASALAIASAQVDRLGNSLYVDVTESLFVIVALLALADVRRRPSMRAYGAAGLLLAAAFWTKESALLLTPLPIVLLAFAQRSVTRRDLVGLACYALALGVPLGAWWLWVAHYAGSTYLAGAIGTIPAYLLAAAPFAAAAALLAAAARMHRPFAARRPRRIVGATLIIGWNVLWLWGLETHSWPYAHDYLATVPRYLWDVGPAVQPFFLLGPAWLYVGWRALRGSEAHAVIVLTALLFLPFFMFTANRFLALRDSLPLVYLSFGAIAIAVTEGARWVAARLVRTDTTMWAAALSAVAISLAVVPQVLRNYETGLNPAEVSGGSDWNGSVARSTAAWIASNVPPGETIMSSRLYYSSIFTLTGAKYPIVQLPTLRVQFEGTALRAMSTQFRWEDDQLWRYGHGSWLYVRRYPTKGYLVGLTQDDLISDLRRRHASFLVVTGEDAGFSSFTYLDYFLNAPGMRLVHIEADGHDHGAYIFAIAPSQLAARPFPLTMSLATEAALRQDLGSSFDRAVEALAPSLRTSGATGLPAAAIAELAGAEGRGAAQ